jgi:transmembrane sensor
MNHMSFIPDATTRTLLDAYFAGEATPAEAERVEAYLAEHPFDAAFRRSVRRALDLPQAQRSLALDKAVRALSDRIAQLRDADGHATPARGPLPQGNAIRRTAARAPADFRWHAWWIGVAAAGFATLITLVVRHHTTDPSARTGQVRSYATTVGQTATVTLADGSRVILAPQTTLRVSGARTLTLIGEAMFDVTSNAHAPFTVRTGAIVTRVLGTRFDVRRYADDREGTIRVLSGKVAVQGYGAPVVLSAGMSSTLLDSLVTEVRTDDVSRSVDWTDGQLAFRHVPVTVVLATLHRWYGYEFRTTDSTLEAGYVTIVLPIGQPDEMIQRLQHLLGVRATRCDSVVTLRPDSSRRTSGAADRVPTHSPFAFSPEVGR